ncbi:MAG: BMP family ABC transporter substrate-binding protein [Lachnospiraceae bacterium]|nr:BMP family ABC transporter substrate-binding protein [Lachnospiraceae bacterium]
MKKLLALALALCMVASCVACGSGSSGKDSGSYKVAMITDYGDITDQSFNQTTYEACKAFCEANKVDFTYYKPAGDSTADRVAMVDTAVADGYNVLVMPGYAFAGTIVQAAPSYPDVKFIALDVSEGDLLAEAVGASYDYNPDNWNLSDYIDMSNVYCAIYQEELSGFMAGYAAVSLGYTELGFLGGMAVPAVIRYGFGFVQGADAAASAKGTTVNIKYAYGNQFFGDADITAAMDTWYSGGTQIVFACGGGIYSSACEAAAKVNGKVIGVDVDQKATIDGAYGEGMTVTSAMKGLAATVNSALTDVVLNNKWSDYSGKISNLGLVSGTDASLNYCQLPIEGTQFGDGFSQDDYKKLVADMYNGVIKVSNDITAMPATTNATVDDQGNIK